MRAFAALFALSLLFVNPYLRGDGNGYYAWLRSPLIDGDVDFANEYQRADPMFRAGFLDEAGRPSREMTTPAGRAANQWSIGPALLWLPFFAVAHVLALAGAGPADGYSPIYLWSVAVGTAIYGFLSLVLGVAIARGMRAGRWAVPAAAALLGASSLPVYMYLLPFHVHALAAFATGLFFWWGLLCVDEDERSVVKAWGAWGAFGGLMVAVYFVHAVFLVAVLWRLARTRGARPRAVRLAAFGAGALPFAALHLWSRWAVYGSFGTGYRDEFFWSAPRLMATALSAEHGLLLWTPIVALALAGLLALARGDVRARVILVVWALLFYVIASYQNWHGQSSFGNRFFVSLVPLFVPGVALALGWMRGRARLLPAAVIAVLCLWNAGFVFQWGLNIVPSRGPVSFAEVARNQVTIVPARLGATVMRYFTGRGAMTREIEADDLRERDRYRLQR